MTKKNGITATMNGNLLPALRTETLECVVSPSTNVYETPDAYVLVLEMPGVTKDAINIAIEKGALSVKANIGIHRSDGARLLVRELRATMYYRVFNVAANIEQNGIDAGYENGVLMIKLLKKEESKPRAIEIK